MHRGPCGKHKLNSSEKVLVSTIHVSHNFALRSFPFSLLLRKLFHLPSLDGRAGEAGRDGSGWLALASSGQEHGGCPSRLRVAPAGQGTGLGGSATCAHGARWRSSGGGGATAAAVARKGKQKGRRMTGMVVEHMVRCEGARSGEDAVAASSARRPWLPCSNTRA